MMYNYDRIDHEYWKGGREGVRGEEGERERGRGRERPCMDEAIPVDCISPPTTRGQYQNIHVPSTLDLISRFALLKKEH